MELTAGRHLGYCTNIHRGETWSETFDGLRRHTLAVRRKVCPPDKPYGIGLRLSGRAAQELEGQEAEFQRWLEKENCYVFTINGFPYGAFHGVPVKERVFRPDWTTAERFDYTARLFRILARLQPPGREGSVSTLPASHKTFHISSAEEDLTRKRLGEMALFLEDLSEESGMDLHLGLEPEPLGLFETTPETIAYLEKLYEGGGDEGLLRRRIGVNFDTCHLALQYENVGDSLRLLKERAIRVSKIHLSSALKLRPSVENLKALRRFQEEVYLHQVIVRAEDGSLERFLDLPPALASGVGGEEWRVHFHVPLHARPGGGLEDTMPETLEALDVIATDAELCRHFEMETYTWEVLPEALRAESVDAQLEKEYAWCLGECRERNLEI